MKLAVITPIGPGHQQHATECAASVTAAIEYCRGPFAEIRHVLHDDTRGMHGRSRSRNLAADANPADWYFFIDADDLCAKPAFARFGDAIDGPRKLDAVFGAVCTDTNGVNAANVYPLDWNTLLKRGPIGTLSMGCFVRAESFVRFNEELNAGEDFDFYLRLLHGRRWAKIERPFVTIRTSVPSATGPRGYTSLDWVAACKAVLRQWKTVHLTAR